MGLIKAAVSAVSSTLKDQWKEAIRCEEMTNDVLMVKKTTPTGVELLAELRDLGVNAYSTGGETADVGDLVRTIIVDSTVTCRMKRKDVISNGNIRPGDVIVGLSSYGQASYEKSYNGGMGSNGLTSARHDVFGKYLATKYPESYDNAVPDELVYSGTLKLTDKIAERQCR